jgi:hypothetical protein
MKGFGQYMRSKIFNANPQQNEKPVVVDNMRKKCMPALFFPS